MDDPFDDAVRGQSPEVSPPRKRIPPVARPSIPKKRSLDQAHRAEGPNGAAAEAVGHELAEPGPGVAPSVPGSVRVVRVTGGSRPARTASRTAPRTTGSWWAWWCPST